MNRINFYVLFLFAMINFTSARCMEASLENQIAYQDLKQLNELLTYEYTKSSLEKSLLIYPDAYKKRITQDYNEIIYYQQEFLSSCHENVTRQFNLITKIAQTQAMHHNSSVERIDFYLQEIKRSHQRFHNCLLLLEYGQD